MSEHERQELTSQRNLRILLFVSAYVMVIALTYEYVVDNHVDMHWFGVGPDVPWWKILTYPLIQVQGHQFTNNLVTGAALLGVAAYFFTAKKLLLCIMAGWLVSGTYLLFFGPDNGVTVGSSGILFCVGLALFTDLLCFTKDKHWSLLLLLGLYFILPLVSQNPTYVSLAAHISGGVTGVIYSVVSYLIIPSQRPEAYSASSQDSPHPTS